MPSVYVIILAFLILVASFTELLVFNEEVLLALCFVAFVFFAYSYLGQTVLSIFEDRASKFEADLLQAFGSNFNSTLSSFYELLIIKGFSSKIAVLEILLLASVDSYIVWINKNVIAESSGSLASKLNDYSLFESKLISSKHSAFVQTILYPLIFSLGKGASFDLIIKK